MCSPPPVDSALPPGASQARSMQPSAAEAQAALPHSVQSRVFATSLHWRTGTSIIKQVPNPPPHASPLLTLMMVMVLHGDGQSMQNLMSAPESARVMAAGKRFILSRPCMARLEAPRPGSQLDSPQQTPCMPARIGLSQALRESVVLGGKLRAQVQEEAAQHSRTTGTSSCSQLPFPEQQQAASSHRPSPEPPGGPYSPCVVPLEAGDGRQVVQRPRELALGVGALGVDVPALQQALRRGSGAPGEKRSWREQLGSRACSKMQVDENSIAAHCWGAGAAPGPAC